MQALVTFPALFSVPSTLTIGLGHTNFFVGILHLSAVLWLTKFSVAPLSISAIAFSAAIFREWQNSISTFSEFQ
jgi:hypothetical protein